MATRDGQNNPSFFTVMVHTPITVWRYEADDGEKEGGDGGGREGGRERGEYIKDLP